MNSANNATLLTLGVGAIATGIQQLTTHDYIGGGILVAVGIVLFFIYEYAPNKTS